MMRQQTYSAKKQKVVKELAELLQKYSVVGLAKVEKVPAKALHGLRNTLRGDVVIRMAKKKLVQFAFKEAGKDNLLDLAEQMQGITALLFTNMNPIKLAQYIESKAVKGPAKAGDIAPIDIVVKAGDTKLAPGPIISELSQNLKVQTLIKAGTIHIRADHVSHKPGDLITAKQAQLLARLGVEPMTIKLDFYSAWENGEIIPESVLHLDVEALLDDVRLAASEGLNLALGLGMITPETVSTLVARAAANAKALAIGAEIFIPDMIGDYFAKAMGTAQYIDNTLFGTGESAAPAAEAPKEEEPEEEEEEESGLGSLFG